MNTFRWSSSEVAGALAIRPVGDADLHFARISTDTRAIQPGDLFVALRGERFDAHDYLAEAASKGATGAVVSRIPRDAPAGMALFLVDDTLHALGALAHHRRLALTARMVGVVGSNGKTSTKDLIRAALGNTFRVHATEGNFNNQIGVPLTLLAAPDDAEVVVVEMGTNEPGEIEILTRIVQPQIVVITSIGEEHLEKLGTLAGVLDEEISVLRGVKPDATALIADEPAELATRAREILPHGRIRIAGFSDRAELRPDGGVDGIETLPDGSTRWHWRGHEVLLPMPGRWNVRNALLALGVANELGVDDDVAARALAAVRRARLRGEWRTIGEMRILADCYNSNPPSLGAAVELLATLPAAGRKVAVVGTMRELGVATAAIHQRAAQELLARLDAGVDLIVATGAFVPAFRDLGAQRDRVVIHENPLEAYAAAAGWLRGDEVILLKASRGEALERWLPLLERDFAAVDRVGS